MKPIQLLTGLLFLVLISCTDNNDWQSATFTGQDYTMTMCSGGYFFTVDSIHLRAYDIAENSILNENTEFPVTCLIKYEKPTGGCYDAVSNLVKITAIKLSN